MNNWHVQYKELSINALKSLLLTLPDDDKRKQCVREEIERRVHLK